MPVSPLHAPLLDWYAAHARDLPWRQPGVSAWDVLVSEVMLQQTPVARVLPVWLEWTARWPTAAALAAEAPGEAVRAWGRLGYPRRALRLHAAAVVVTEQHGGELPDELAALRTLPGVGAYTAAAVLSFAHGRRHAVLDTNVRRVLARVGDGVENAGPSATAAEYARAEALLPDDPGEAARWAVATMELGALVCTARAPRCSECPVADACRWRAAGYPAAQTQARRPQAFAGTDRQVRGRLMAVLRTASEPVPRDLLDEAWHLPEQRERALAALAADGLASELPDGRWCLPGTHGPAAAGVAPAGAG
ncbi:A/G-specific adenine glycosylase [Motilibacter peucedani]|uniref:Adenine DNA glycosylase n=1 Tax=Motilibacter peucedani TaxID=598650 RepID=A0A420XPS2_9ACTN|nr:A/G-specific adenine glycosylase [Motilibacter peucedani]RKS75245.1 A/G-specific adenine glycosylase [Motilibacter peucedani]